MFFKNTTKFEDNQINHKYPKKKDKRSDIENFPKLKKFNKIANKIKKIAEKMQFVMFFIKIFVFFLKNKILKINKNNPKIIPQNKKIKKQSSWFWVENII